MILVPDNRAPLGHARRCGSPRAFTVGGLRGFLGPVPTILLMKIPEEGYLLRIFIGESDRWEGAPLYEALVYKARADGLAGATVLRGLMGFGAQSRIHTAKILRLSEDLPIVVEVVDSLEKVERFSEAISPMITDGMVTLEKARVIKYRHKESS